MISRIGANMEKKVNYIPAVRTLRQKKVGIYCRVSTNDMEQLNSLTNQISALTRLVSTIDGWKLVDCYVDIASAKKKSPRSNFERMLDDCKSKKLDIVITKSVSRFGRVTVDTLQALNVMKESGVCVIFEQESLDTKDVESSLMISIIESLAQAENESRSDNIKWGVRQRAAQGTSKLYDRKCYGYKHDDNVKLMKSGNSDVQYLSSDNNPTIISKEVFEAVQIEKAKRSNVVEGDDGKKRKDKKYSSKKRNYE